MVFAIDAKQYFHLISISAIQGTISSTAPGGFLQQCVVLSMVPAVLGIGVWGSRAGSGWGYMALLQMVLVCMVIHPAVMGICQQQFRHWSECYRYKWYCSQFIDL